MASLLLICILGADPASHPTLQDCNVLVGQWRGVGQVRRGSTKGAWQVQGEWKWRFDAGPQASQPDPKAPQSASKGSTTNRQLEYSAKNGKYIRSANLLASDQGPQLKIDGEVFALEAKANAAKSSEPFDLLSKPMVFAAARPLENGLARVTVRMVARGDRLLMRLETKRPSGRFALLGEVGFTRVGSKFGQGGSYVECVVTGGLGTIPVKHDGKTYYVCCTGCKEYFEADPEGVLAEYRARQAEEKNAADNR